MILCLAATVAEPNSSGCQLSNFSRKPYSFLHNWCSQVFFNKKLPMKVGEQAAQCLNSFLRQNSNSKTKGSVDSLRGRWPRAKKEATRKSRELVLKKDIKVDFKCNWFLDTITRNTQSSQNHGCFVGVSMMPARWLRMKYQHMLFVRGKGWPPLWGASHRNSQDRSSFSGVKSLFSLCEFKKSHSLP